MKLDVNNRLDTISKLKELFPTNNPASWRILSDKKLTEYFKEHIIVNSLEQLKEICLKSNTGADFALMLNSGLRSSKHIQYNKDEKTFFILNEIDGSEQELTEVQIMNKKYTNIGEGIKKKALRFEYLN